MFKVGDKVYSKLYGNGIVLNILPSLAHPVLVRFEGAVWQSYTYTGACFAGKITILKDIVLAKKGSPDARKIVALLARTYHRHRRYTNSTITEEVLYNMYNNAKQLLGKDDEN